MTSNTVILGSGPSLTVPSVANRTAFSLCRYNTNTSSDNTAKGNTMNNRPPPKAYQVRRIPPARLARAQTQRGPLPFVQGAGPDPTATTAPPVPMETLPLNTVALSPELLRSPIGKDLANARFVDAQGRTLQGRPVTTPPPVPEQRHRPDKLPPMPTTPPGRTSRVMRWEGNQGEVDLAQAGQGRKADPNILKANPTSIPHSVVPDFQEEEAAQAPTPKQTRRPQAHSAPSQSREWKKGESLAALARMVFSKIPDEPTPSEEYVRVDLPSRFAFYDFDELFVRPFGPFELARLHAALTERDPSVIYDVMGSCLHRINVRELAVADFTFLLYWQRLKSFAGRVPYTFTWTSQYGNLNEYELSTSNWQVTTATITRDRYQEILAEGYCIPTVRDEEIIRSEDFSTIPEAERDAFQWLFNRAQYILGDTYAEKLQILHDRGNAALVRIKELVPEFEFGITETVTVSDQKFEPTKALVHLRDEIDQRQILLASNPPSNIGAIAFQEIRELSEEIVRIEMALKPKEQKGPEEHVSTQESEVPTTGDEKLPVNNDDDWDDNDGEELAEPGASTVTGVEPKPMTIRLSVSLLSFFPNI